MIWTPRPERIRSYRANGFANMGSLGTEESVGRFSMREIMLGGIRYPIEVWNLIAVRGRFVAGTGDATLSIQLDHRAGGGLYDWTLKTFETMGASDRNLNFHASDDADLWAYPFFLGDELVFDWTNPDSGTMRWVLEVFLHALALGPGADGRQLES